MKKTEIESGSFLRLAERWSGKLTFQAFILVHFLFGRNLSDEFPFTKYNELKTEALNWLNLACDRELSPKKRHNHLCYTIAAEAEKRNWLTWLETLDYEDKKTGESLAAKGYAMGCFLLALAKMNNEAKKIPRLLQNTEEISFVLLARMQHFLSHAIHRRRKELGAKLSASVKTLKVEKDRAIIKKLLEARGISDPDVCLSANFWKEAKNALGVSKRTVQRRLSEIKKDCNKAHSVTNRRSVM